MGLIKSINNSDLRKYSLSQLKIREKTLKKAEKKELNLCKSESGRHVIYLFKIADELGNVRGIIIEKQVEELLKK
ncbi:MAG: hypothetical protein Q7R95_07805 [bacterium]|nr:hypothetical protein [bacterium]